MATIEKLKEYITKVLSKTGSKTEVCNDIFFAIANGILLKTKTNLKVLSSNGETNNALWLLVGKRRLCIVYKDNDDCIEIRESNLQGDVLESFSNRTSKEQVKLFFENL